VEIGDTVERHLKNGDIVLFNRQPTLHRGSMLAKPIIVRGNKTFRFNLASTKSFNAD
jgi:DNA-directed RNA polymerase beta' subunit